MIGYKALNKDFTCRGFKYEIGKTYEIDGELKMCGNGFHFCKNPIDVFGYYLDNEDTVVVKVEATGDILQEGTKFVTSKIKILETINPHDSVCVGRNSGNFNSGEYNSGHYNSGHCNSGSCNSGSCNSGDRNSGSCNSGDCNSGDYNSGFFNTNEPKLRMFNQDTELTYTQFIKSINYDFDVLMFRIYERKISDADIQHIKALPNFDADIFKEITGIDINDGSEV